LPIKKFNKVGFNLIKERLEKKLGLLKFRKGFQRRKNVKERGTDKKV